MPKVCPSCWNCDPEVCLFHVKSNSHTSTTLADFNHNPLNAIQPKSNCNFLKSNLRVQHGVKEPTRTRLASSDSNRSLQDIISTPVGFYFIQDAARLLNLTSTTRGTQLNILTINYEYMQTRLSRTTPGHRGCTRACIGFGEQGLPRAGAQVATPLGVGRSAVIVLVPPQDLVNAPSPRRLSTTRPLGRRPRVAWTRSDRVGLQI
ncbi:hypothetical protein C8R43DRAFT_1008007 [Mycena crocata]|nr:hypothetical protein C8R43DRAFT_1008007 [Mycena crocata]